MIVPQRHHAFLCPPIAGAGSKAIPIKERGNPVIPAYRSENPHHIDRLNGCVAAGLAAAPAADAEFGVRVSFPMEDQNNLALIRIHVHRRLPR